MAIGWLNKDVRVAGRKSIGEASVVRPGTHSDGQPRDGTPAGRQSTQAARSKYTDAAAKKHRDAERGIGDRGLSDGGTFGQSSNQTVHSKNTKRYGRDGSKGDFPHSSTGQQPAPIERSTGTAALYPRTSGSFGKIAAERVGVVDGKFKYPSYKNSKAKKHTGHSPDSPGVARGAPLDRGDYTGGKYPGPR